MSDSTKGSVGRLLRVLVAGGVALAGVTGTAMAEDKAPAEKGATEKAAEKAKDKGKGKTEEKKKDAKEAEKDAGGGVKGW